MDIDIVKEHSKNLDMKKRLFKKKEEEAETAAIFRFSGDSSAKLPESFLPSRTLADDATFTIVFWFR